MRSLLKGERTSWSTEKRYVRVDGRAVWAGVTTSLRRDAHGRPVCFLTLIQDISEKRSVEEALRSSEEKFRDAFLLSPDSVNINRLDDGRFVSINEGFTRVMGYRPEEVLGKTSVELNIWESPDDRKRLVAALRAEGRVENVEARFRGKDGAVRFGLMSAAVIDLDDVPHIMSITRDVTDRRNAEVQAQAIQREKIRLLEEADRSRRALLNLAEDQVRTEAALRTSEAKYRQLSVELEARVRERTVQLEASNRELEAFSYSVSHDLRAPLRAIEGFSALIVEHHEAQMGPEGHRLFGVVRANAWKMARLIDDLLAFSRTGRSTMVYGRLDMGAVARSVFEEVVTETAVRSRIDFTVGSLPEVEGDVALMRQVWVNLLSNAVKFSAKQERPVIEVTGDLEGDRAVFHVKDNGAGFDMAYVGKLFGVFQRLHGATEFEGTGVGLALAQRIVSRHGGRVWAEGAVGLGAAISFEIPVKGPAPV